MTSRNMKIKNIRNDTDSITNKYVRKSEVRN